MGIRTLIVEDEPMARMTLRDFASQVEWLDVIGEAADGRTAARLIDELRPDLVLLDIRMPELSGLQVLERVTHEPAIVFTTAHDHYAVTAFELEALDYLLKPFGRGRFEQAMEKVRRRLSGPVEACDVPPAKSRAAAALRQEPVEQLERLFVRDARGRVAHVRVGEIVRLAAADDYVEVHAKGGAYLVHLTLTDFEHRLDPSRFRRVHRSHIINLDHVRSIENFDRRLRVVMSDGSEVVSSRAGSQLLKDLIL